jgi:hypothetical protein
VEQGQGVAGHHPLLDLAERQRIAGRVTREALHDDRPVDVGRLLRDLDVGDGRRVRGRRCRRRDDVAGTEVRCESVPARSARVVDRHEAVTGAERRVRRADVRRGPDDDAVALRCHGDELAVLEAAALNEVAVVEDGDGVRQRDGCAGRCRKRRGRGDRPRRRQDGPRAPASAARDRRWVGHVLLPSRGALL